jgi:hypothetical protein
VFDVTFVFLRGVECCCNRGRADEWRSLLPCSSALHGRFARASYGPGGCCGSLRFISLEVRQLFQWCEALPCRVAPVVLPSARLVAYDYSVQRSGFLCQTVSEYSMSWKRRLEISGHAEFSIKDIKTKSLA